MARWRFFNLWADSSRDSFGSELAFEFPGLAVRVERFTDPVKRIRRDFGESPTGWCAVPARADLNDVVGNAAPDLLFVVTGQGICPADEPGLTRRIPDPKRGSIHVIGPAGLNRALRTARHDPDVLHRAAFEHPPKVHLASEVERENVDRLVVENFQVPTADQPAIDVGRFWNFRAAARSRQYGVKTVNRCGSESCHRSVSSGHPKRCDLVKKL